MTILLELDFDFGQIGFFSIHFYFYMAKRFGHSSCLFVLARHPDWISHSTVERAPPPVAAALVSAVASRVQ